VHGLCTVRVWSVHGLSAWSMRGLCMVCVWSVHSPCIVRARSVHGLGMVVNGLGLVVHVSLYNLKHPQPCLNTQVCFMCTVPKLCNKNTLQCPLSSLPPTSSLLPSSSPPLLPIPWAWAWLNIPLLKMVHLKYAWLKWTPYGTLHAIFIPWKQGSEQACVGCTVTYGIVKNFWYACCFVQ